MIGEVLNVLLTAVLVFLAGITLIGGIIALGTIAIDALAGAYSLGSWIIDGLRD